MAQQSEQQQPASGADKPRRSLYNTCGKIKGAAVSLYQDGNTLKKVADVTSFLPGVGHSQAVYAKYEGDNERAAKYATRATGTTAAIGATMATGGLAVWGGVVGGAISGVAVASGAGAIGTTAGLATRRGVEAVSWNYTDDPEVAKMSNKEIVTKVAVGGAVGAFGGTLSGAGKELGTRAVGQGGLGTQTGAFLGNQLGVHGATRAAVKQGTTIAEQQVVNKGLTSCALYGEPTLDGKAWQKVVVSAIIESEAFQENKGTHAIWKFEIANSSDSFIRNDIDGWLDIGDFRYVVLKHSFDYKKVFIQATPLSQCSALGSRMWRAATYNPLHHAAAKLGLDTGGDSEVFTVITVAGIDLNVYVLNS